MAKSLTQLQAESDARRGLKIKSFKLKVEDIALIEKLAQKCDMPQNALIAEAIRFYAEHKKTEA